jgi:hypothetical protein
MEFTKVEVTLIEQTVKENAEKEIRDLAELQLVLVGGGIGDIVWG